MFEAMSSSVVRVASFGEQKRAWPGEGGGKGAARTRRIKKCVEPGG